MAETDLIVPPNLFMILRMTVLDKLTHLQSLSHHRAAYKWWAESLDTILNITDSLKKWRDLTSSSDSSVKPASVLLQKCGLWGCLLGGVLAAKIAQ